MEDWLYEMNKELTYLKSVVEIYKARRRLMVLSCNLQIYVCRLIVHLACRTVLFFNIFTTELQNILFMKFDNQYSFRELLIIGCF